MPKLSSPEGANLAAHRRTRRTRRTLPKFAPPGASAGNNSPEDHLMSRDQVSRRYRRLLERLSPPSSAAGLALTVIAVGAAIVAMVKCECRDGIDR